MVVLGRIGRVRCKAKFSSSKSDGVPSSTMFCFTQNSSPRYLRPLNFNDGKETWTKPTSYYKYQMKSIFCKKYLCTFHNQLQCCKTPRCDSSSEKSSSGIPQHVTNPRIDSLHCNLIINICFKRPP